MKCVFFRGYDFPIGGASQNRLMGICRALLSVGISTEVYVYGPARNSIRENVIPTLIHKGVLIHHCTFQKAHNIKFLKEIAVLYGFVVMLFSTWLGAKKIKVDFIFINSTNLLYLVPVYLLCRLIKAKLGRDLNEYPTCVLRNGSTNNAAGLLQRLSYKFQDIAFIMTRELTRYYSCYLRRDCRTLLLPITVDWDRFNSKEKISGGQYLITYCGDLSQAKDGVVDLIKAYAIASKSIKNPKLLLIGYNSDRKYMSELVSVIDKLGQANTIEFTGFVHPDKIPDLLQNSDLLVLSRPDNIQAQGGFPTKLGEYLATGNPIVVTDVGEISHYLVNEVSAFISEPNALSFSAAILKAYNCPDRAEEIGEAGKKVAETYFSHLSQGRLLSDFLCESMQ